MRHTILLFLFSLSLSSTLFSQQTEDVVVPISATVDIATPSVTVTWELNSPTADLLLIRREKDAGTWFVMLDTMSADITSFTDPFVVAGQVYEYGMIRASGGLNAFGYITVSLESPVVDSRGTMLIFVEEALQTPLATELNRLERDLIGDGWKVNWHPVSPSANVDTIKSQIVDDYNMDAENVKSVLLLGEIPVPYSGNTAWDGHTDHQGAWPADTYYGDVDGVWTDEVVNNTTPSRPANDNIPGDGKFDHSIAPTATELAVGRVDFSNLNETTFGMTRVELMRRYLNKNHNWRTKQYTVSNNAMVDDNFGFFGGEAFAANGYRNYYPVVGKDNVMDAHFFQDTNDQSFLFGYGCGGGSYTSASGVGNSGNFASDTVNIVFATLFGSYHGDWDSENNPFMMSALASEGGILSCSWAGRPHWFNHSLAAGETLGYSTLATQNSCDNIGYFGSFGECGVHVTLLGDPSLRVHVVDPVSDLSINNKCNSVELSWEASSAQNLLGYLVFRANAMNADYDRLTADPIPSTMFTDNAPLNGDNFYQVKAVVMETTPSGSYQNSSTGLIVQNNFAIGTPPTISIASDTLSCTNSTVTISATTNASQPTFSWSGPGGFTSSEATIEVDVLGEYVVTVVDGISGCSNTELTVIVMDNSLPNADPSASGNFSCVNPLVQLFANPDQSGYSFQWTGPNSFSSNDENPFVNLPGVYNLTVTAQNGCSANFSVEASQDLEIPNATATGGTITCSNPQITIDGTGSSTGPNFVYQWTTSDGNILSGENTLTPVVDGCGTYSLSIVNISNGCFSMTEVVIDCDLAAPDISIDLDGDVLCSGDFITATASSTVQGATYFWEGPGINDPTNPIQMITNGMYTLTVTSPNGCTSSETFQVAGPTDMSISITTVLTDCQGFSHVDAFVTGGTAPYVYEFNPMPPFPPNTNFTVTVTDANGCTVTASGVSPDFQPIEITIDHTNETVIGANDGLATANAQNGIPPFSYLWSNGEDTQTISDLPPGIYTVSITDSNGCESTATVEILEGSVATEYIDGLRNIALFPNPTAGNALLSVQLDYPMLVAFEITDVVGQQVMHIPAQLTSDQTFDIDSESVPAGIYFCKIQLGEQAITRRLVRL